EGASYSTNSAPHWPVKPKQPAMPAERIKIDRVFHALGDATRRAILEKLAQEPVSASRLAEPLHLTLAAVVQHLQILVDSGLVRAEKIGRARTSRIEPNGVSVAEPSIRDRRTTRAR